LQLEFEFIASGHFALGMASLHRFHGGDFADRAAIKVNCLLLINIIFFTAD
jgi:hypothetical protein